MGLVEIMLSSILRRVFSVCYCGVWRCRGVNSIARRAMYALPFLAYVYDRCLLQPSLPNEDITVAWDDQRIMIENPRHNVISQDILLKGVWEPEVTEYLCPRIKAGMTVIDVGADTGYYTLLFAKRVGRLGRVVAFEPIPSARETLEHNIRLNNYTNVTVCDFALFSSNGLFILEGPRELSRINPMRSGMQKGGIEIQTRIFDECTGGLNIRKIDVVKIDVEGAEMDVLHGMRQSLEKYHPELLVEVHPDHLAHFSYEHKDLLRFLESMKYRVQPVDRPDLNFKHGNITISCT